MFFKSTLLVGCIYLFSISICYGQFFADVSNSSGVGFEHSAVPFSVDQPWGTGAAWFDYNKDGFLDLYVTNRFTANKLFENNGDGTFTDVAASLGVADATSDGAGVVIGDINNDGYQDIFLANGDQDKLFINNGGTSFTDATAGSGLEVSVDSRGTSASFGDYDNDGFLDLYVAHHDIIPGSSGLASLQDRLFYNNGNETFTDVSSLLDVSELMEAGFIASWTDYDNDGDQDIILINDCGYGTLPLNGTRIFKNNGGTHPITDWEFAEVSSSVIGDCSHGMGLGIGDYNRDGWMDIVYTDIGPINLFENNNGVFSQMTSLGVGVQQLSHFSWGTSFLDFDNDADQDIAVAVGGYWPDVAIQESNFLMNQSFNGNNYFVDIAPSLGLNEDAQTRTIVHGDYDNDGDLDLLMVNYDTIVSLYRNDLNNGNNYLRVFLEGVNSNKDGIGAKVKVTTPDGIVQFFEMRSGSNLGGGDEIVAHFGLGINTMVNEVEVTWLSGSVNTLNNVSINQTILIVEAVSPLPIELTEFSGKTIKDKVQLNWTTLSETDNDFFEIERSRDGSEFEKIGIREGKGNVQTQHHYDLIDERPFIGKNYYRLKQIDIDGSFSYSHIIVVTVKPNRVDPVNIYPNPVIDNVFFTQISSEIKTPFTIELFDLNGKLVLQKSSEVDANESLVFEVSTSGLANGIYICKTTHLTGTTSKKIVLQN